MKEQLLQLYDKEAKTITHYCHLVSSDNNTYKSTYAQDIRYQITSLSRLRGHSVCKIGYVLGDVLYGTDFSFVVGAITYVHTVLNIMIMMAQTLTHHISFMDLIMIVNSSLLLLFEL